MRNWFISVGLILALTGGVVGVSAHESEGSCPMGNMPECCKKAHSSGDSPEISMARLCCNLNCSEPGSGGNGNTSSFSNQSGTLLSSAILTNAKPLTYPTAFLVDLPSNNSHDSNPKYIQHLALLI
jgi:hypothetical protein